MKIRNLIASAGLALVMGCAPAVKKVEEPRFEPFPAVQADRPKDNTSAKYFISGYEITLASGNYREMATYSHYQGKRGMHSCLSLNAEGKDWVKVCSENDESRINTVSNFTTFLMCRYDGNGKAVEDPADGSDICTSKVYMEAQEIFDRWKVKLEVDKHHKVWLKKRQSPLSDWQ